MDRKIIKNFIYNSVYQIMIIFIPFITIPYVSRIFNPSEMGIFGTTTSIASFFVTIAIFALNYYGVREIAKVKDSEEDLSIKYYEIRFLQKIMVVVTIIVYIFLFFIVKNSALNIAYLVQGIYLIATYFDISWLFMGLEQFDKTFLRNTLAKIISIIGIFIFVKNNLDIYIYIALIPLSTLIGNLSMWSYRFKIIKKCKVKDKKLKIHFKGAFFLFLPTIFTNIYLVLDRSILSLVNDFTEVGMYDQSQKIIRIVIGIVTSLSVVMLPRISNMINKKNNKLEIESLLQKSFNLTLFIAIGATIGIFSISDNFVPWFYSTEYLNVILLIKISAFVCLFTALGSFFSNQCAIPINNKKAYIIPLVVAAITSIILNLFLGKYFGAVGSAITIVIVEFLALLLRVFYLRLDFDIKKFFEKIHLFFISGIFMFLSIYYLKKVFKLEPQLSSTILEIIIGIIVYILAILILEKEYRNFLKNFIEKIKGRRGVKK